MSRLCFCSGAKDTANIAAIDTISKKFKDTTPPLFLLCLNSIEIQRWPFSNLSLSFFFTLPRVCSLWRWVCVYVFLFLSDKSLQISTISAPFKTPFTFEKPLSLLWFMSTQGEKKKKLILFLFGIMFQLWRVLDSIQTHIRRYLHGLKDKKHDAKQEQLLKFNVIFLS